jgi:hypothetical protein
MEETNMKMVLTLASFLIGLSTGIFWALTAWQTLPKPAEISEIEKPKQPATTASFSTEETDF